MAKLLNLHRAARLVGVTRGALQKKIQDGELDSFDGMITIEELQRVFPDATLENNSVLEQVAQIKEAAFGLRVRERALPDKEVLAARLHDISNELAETKALLKHALGVIDHLESQLADAPAAMADFAQALRERLHRERMETPAASASLRALLIRDSYLRVISAEVTVLPGGSVFFVEGNDTLLDGALRAGIAVPYGCSDGSCGKCHARVLRGEVAQVRPHGCKISPSEAGAGSVLLCAWTAVSEVQLETKVAQDAGDISEQALKGEVSGIDFPTEEVAVVHVKTPPANRLRFLAGQRAVLTLAGSMAQSLTIASCPCEDRHLEFHVRRLPGNFFSDYVFDRLGAGEGVHIHGPDGTFVLDGKSTRPIVFFAFCNGFAAVKSMMEHAMALDHGEGIHLIWIATKPSGIYLEGLARAWADALDNFTFETMVLGSALDATASRQIQAVEQALAPKVDELGSVAELDFYLAGPALIVEAIRRMLVSKGAPEAAIHVEVV